MKIKKNVEKKSYLLKMYKSLQREISERKQTEKALEHSERLFKTIFDNASIGISLLNKEGFYKHVNSTLCQMLGYTEEELRKKNFREITYPEDIHASIDIWVNIWEGKYPSVSYEKRYICKNGDILWTEASISSIRRDEVITDVIVVAQDITVRKRMELELTHQATTDFLTGIYNRRAFMLKAQEEFSRALRYQRALALLFIDIDRFKSVNDCYGHLVGDRVLRAVVNACKLELRDTDVFARMGGEEFAVILIEQDIISAETVALRIQQRVNRLIVKMDKNKIQVTVSIGISSRRDEDISLEDIIRRADDALYQAKNSGRNRIVLERDHV